MSRRRTPMRSVRQILEYRLSHGKSYEITGSTLGISAGTARNVCTLFAATGLPWPLPEGMSDSQLEAKLYPAKPAEMMPKSPLLDPAYITRELARKHVTRKLLHAEYIKEHPDGMSLAHYYRYVHAHLAPEVTMHFDHKGGDRQYSDYSGDGIPYTDFVTGEVQMSELFVTCLAASSYTYAEATQSQCQDNFALSHVRAFDFFGGVPASVMPDNLKSGVTKADYFDPTINRLFAKLAEHYGTVIIPARAMKPRDKGGVESAVLVSQRNIIAALRDRIFYSIAEINAAVREQVKEINLSPMKDHGGRSRLDRFYDSDQPFLKPLPSEAFSISHIKHNVAVARDYHVQYDKHHYSVPYTLVGKKVDIHLNGMTIEIYHDNIHCCRHPLRTGNYGYSTHPEHMPPHHAFVKGWSAAWFISKAKEIGPHTADYVAAMIGKSSHEEHGYRAAQGLLRLAKSYPSQRIENACLYAQSLNALKLSDIKSVLEQGIDLRQTIPFPQQAPVVHENIRGPGSYSTNPS